MTDLGIGIHPDDIENVLYLSERNLRVLLSKLERFKKGEKTRCAIVKYKNVLDPYCMSIASEREVMVVAIPDSSYYVNRPAGEMLEIDTPK